MKIQRNDFFSGKFLNAEDLALEQSYLIGSKKSPVGPQSMFEANVSVTIGALRAVNLKNSVVVGVNGVEVQRMTKALVREPASPINERMNALREQLEILKDRKGDLVKKIMEMEGVITGKEIAAAEAAEKPDLSGEQQQVEELKGLLAQVDAEIKVVMQEINNLKSVEDASHQNLSDTMTALKSNLQKATDQYALVRQSVS
jgi:hypothetical protein